MIFKYITKKISHFINRKNDVEPGYYMEINGNLFINGMNESVFKDKEELLDEFYKLLDNTWVECPTEIKDPLIANVHINGNKYFDLFSTMLIDNSFFELILNKFNNIDEIKRDLISGFNESIKFYGFDRTKNWNLSQFSEDLVTTLHNRRKHAKECIDNAIKNVEKSNNVLDIIEAVPANVRVLISWNFKHKMMDMFVYMIKNENSKELFNIEIKQQ